MTANEKQEAFVKLIKLLLEQSFLQGALFGYQCAMTTAGDTISTRMKQLLAEKKSGKQLKRDEQNMSIEDKGAIDSDLVTIVAKDHAERISNKIMDILRDKSWFEEH